MPGVIGLDIGGVNTKAVWRDGDAVRTILRPYDVVRDPGALTAVVRDVVAELAAEPPELVALTMTAELSDEFRTKREGVGFVLDAVEAAVGGRVLVFTTAGELVSLAEARARPLDVAAANWVASALAVGALHPDALMLDVGSTTADVIPIAAGRVAADRSHGPRPAARGRARLHRRAAHEPGGDRSARPGPRALVPGRVRAVRDQRRRAPDPRPPRTRGLHVPDAGRAGRRASSARGSASRGWSAPTPSSSKWREIEAIAAFLHDEQVRQIEAAVRQVGTDAAIVPLGVGAFLARAVAERLGRPVLELPWSAEQRDAAPAAALADLAAAHLSASC